jgi:hypothetical protein
VHCYYTQIIFVFKLPLALAKGFEILLSLALAKLSYSLAKANQPYIIKSLAEANAN